MAQKVEFLAQGLVTPGEPSDEELADWYAANQDRFKQPDLYTLTHIFFDPDKREAATLHDARAVLDEINTLEAVPADYSGYGDPFMLQNYYPSRSAVELRKLFGSGFVEQLVKLAPGSWHGPVLSGYGTHLVLVNDIVLAPQPAYADIKAQLVEEWMSERVRESSEQFIKQLISRYDIVVEETGVPLAIPGVAANP